MPRPGSGMGSVSDLQPTLALHHSSANHVVLSLCSTHAFTLTALKVESKRRTKLYGTLHLLSQCFGFCKRASFELV